MNNEVTGRWIPAPRCEQDPFGAAMRHVCDTRADRLPDSMRKQLEKLESPMPR